MENTKKEAEDSINKYNYKFIKTLFYTWRKYIKFRLNYKYKLYGRISALDVEAVKKMVRKDRGNRFTLLEHTLPVLFEFTGRTNYRRFSVFNELTHGYFLTETGSYYYANFYEDANSNTPDTISFHKNCIVNSYRDIYNDDNKDYDYECSKYKDRIERKEKQTLRILRFLLKQGCNPNNVIFIKNLIFKHKYHCKTFFLKILEMCYNYGLDENILLDILKTTELRFNSINTLYYIRPVLLDIHKNRLSVDDTVHLCIGWATKKNFLYTLMNYGKGDLDILNDDVIGVITSFIYFV